MPLVSPARKTKTAGSGSASTVPRQSQRTIDDLKNLPRSAALSHLYRAAEAASPPNHPPESTFAPSSIWEWLRGYSAYILQKKHAFPPYTASPQEAMYDLRDENGHEDVRVSVAGDWGTGTDEAEAVAKHMERFHPHFTVHIGDVYYIGGLSEINENCLGIKNPSNNYDPLRWPIGSCGSFALNGNHEMYANGNGFFEVFLPRLGLRDAEGRMLGQQTSFFCLQNSHWRIIAIDTGYNSIGVPVLSHIPLINKIPGIGGNCKLPDELTQWLKEVVLPSEDKRGLVILSHHQPYSGFENDYRMPAQQLWDAGVKRPVLWLWGHEHRLAGYELHGEGGLKSFGRCIGHGGMPVSREEPTRDPRPIFYDHRLAANGYGMNGHVNLVFSGRTLTATYVDLNGNQLLLEDWSADENGAVQLLSKRKLIDDPEFRA
jgi:calcineurin-like phosphoesterase family protein